MKRIVLTALALAPLAFPSSAATQKASDVEVYDSTQRYKIEPKRIDLDGMPGPWYFSKLDWRSWGEFKAKSSMARLKVQDCKPSCAEGGLKTIKAKLKLSHPATCHRHRVFSKAVIDPKRGGFAPVGTDIEPEPTLALVISCEGFVTPWGSRTKTALKSFDQCGDRPEQFFFGIRAEGVSCSKARKVAGKWYANGSMRASLALSSSRSGAAYRRATAMASTSSASEATPMRSASRPGDSHGRTLGGAVWPTQTTSRRHPCKAD